MSEQFYTILTNLGKAKIANSGALGTKVNFIKFKVGDGGGTYYNPTEDQTDVKNKVWEGKISSIAINESNPNWIVIETVIPTLVGGFTIREAGIFDDENNLIAIGKYPETYKPIAAEGSSKDLLIRMILEVSNAENVNLKVDPTVILATKKDIQVLEAKVQTINTQLSDFVYQVAGGTGNAVTLTTQTLVNGYAKTFIASANNGGAATTLNGKKLYKPGTTTSPNLITGKAYTVWYNSSGDCFFIKASAEGTALATEVLKGKTFSNDADTGITGTLDLSNLVTGNIKSGVTINGVAGSPMVVDTADAVLDPAYLVTGYSGYDDGIKKAGTMPYNAGLIPGTNHIQSSQFTIGRYSPDGLPRIYVRPGIASARQCIDGDIWISQQDANFVAENIVSGKNIFGLAGTATIKSLGGTVLKSVSGTLAAGQTTVTVPADGTRIIAAFAEAYGARHGNAAGYIGMSVEGVYRMFGCNYTSSSTTDAIEPSIGTGSAATQIYLTNGRYNNARTYYLLYE